METPHTLLRTNLLLCQLWDDGHYLFAITSTCLDLLIPSIEKHVEARRYTSKVNRTTKRGLRRFSAGNPVLARNYGKGEKWVPGVVTEVVCSRHCMV